MPQQPWVPFYGDIPASIPYPDQTLYELVERSAQEYADQTAVEYLGQRITYEDLRATIDRASRSLWALGVRPGDRIGILLPNTPHVIVLLYAANRVGAVVSILHAESTARELADRIGDFDPSWLAVTREHIDGALRLVSSRSVRSTIICSYDDFGRPRSVRRMLRMRHRYRVDLGGIRGTAGRGPTGSGPVETVPVFSWSSFLELASRPRRRSRRGDEGPGIVSPEQTPPEHRELHSPDDLAIVLYTGGTTGPCRGVCHADRQLTAAALQTQVQGPLLAGQSVLGVIPFSHGFGVAVGVHAVLSAGAATIVIPHSTSHSLARAIRRHQPEYLIGVPPTYEGLVRDRVFARMRHRSLMGAFCGGDRLARAVRDRFEAIVRRRGGAVSIREGYGLSETVTACATMPDGESRPGSVGIPYPDTLIAIARPARPGGAGADEPPEWLPTDELGEILVSGPTTMVGYWKDERSTEAAFHIDEEGRSWLRTGDLGRMDSDGFLYYVERMGRSVVLEGNSIHPGLTELMLSEHQEVLEACVTVDRGEDAGRLTAHVAPFDSDRDTEWLESHLRESLRILDPEQRPARYDFRPRLPRTSTGSIDLRALGVAYGRAGK